MYIFIESELVTILYILTWYFPLHSLEKMMEDIKFKVFFQHVGVQVGRDAHKTNGNTINLNYVKAS